MTAFAASSILRSLATLGAGWRPARRLLAGLLFAWAIGLNPGLAQDVSAPPGLPPANDGGSSNGTASAVTTDFLDTPNFEHGIPLQYGSVDAVSGNTRLCFPLGPTLPGRLPVGFHWVFDTAAGGSYGNGPAFYPVWWPTPGTGTVHYIVWFNGEALKFEMVSNPAQGLPSLAKLGGWMTKRGVDASVVQQVSSGATTYASADGTRFLVVGGTAPNYAMVVLNGDEAIWCSNVAPQEGRVSYVTNLWGDRVTITETQFLQWSCAELVTADGVSSWFWSPTVTVPAAPCNVVIQNAVHTGHSITLNFSYTAVGCPEFVTVKNSMGLPEVDLNGFLFGLERETFQYVSGGMSSWLYKTNYTKIFDVTYLPTSIAEVPADGSQTLTTTFGWTPTQTAAPNSAPCALMGGYHQWYWNTVTVPLTSITHPTGLVESFETAQRFSMSQNSFNPCEGNWWGFYPTNPAVVVPGQESIACLSNFVATQTGVIAVTYQGGGLNEKTLIGHLWPTIISPSGGYGTTASYTWVQPKYETAVLHFGTANPTTTDPYRGIHLIHPSGGTWTSPSDPQAFLFATSAVLRSESIYGTGVPSRSTVPGASGSYQVPSGYTVYATTVNDAWSVQCWSNPTGALTVTTVGTGPGLPINPAPMRVSSSGPPHVPNIELTPLELRCPLMPEA